MPRRGRRGPDSSRPQKPEWVVLRDGQALPWNGEVGFCHQQQQEQGQKRTAKPNTHSPNIYFSRDKVPGAVAMLSLLPFI